MTRWLGGWNQEVWVWTVVNVHHVGATSTISSQLPIHLSQKGASAGHCHSGDRPQLLGGRSGFVTIVHDSREALEMPILQLTQCHL